jgi:cytochrome P450
MFVRHSPHTVHKQPPFASREFMADPYPHYVRMRAEAPAVRARVAWWMPSIWVVTRYDDVIRFLKDDRFSKNYFKRFWIPPKVRSMYRSLLTLDPPDHTRLRALVQRAFTPRLVEQMAGDIQRITDDLLDRIAVSSHPDLIRDFAFPLPLTVMEDLLGIPSEERPEFAPWAKQIGTAVASIKLKDQIQALRGAAFFKKYLHELIERRRNEPGEDLLSALIRAEEEGDKLTEEEIISMVLLLLVAGFETTVHLISNGVLTLLQQPDARMRMLEDAVVAESALEEILRYTSPVQFSTPRVALEDVTIGSVTIPRNGWAAAGLGSANRDPSQFPDPDTFDVGRDPNRHLAFGMGSHFCLGAPLARLEGRIALTSLFRRFPGLTLAQPVESLRWKESLAARGVEALPVRVS